MKDFATRSCPREEARRARLREVVHNEIMSLPWGTPAYARYDRAKEYLHSAGQAARNNHCVAAARWLQRVNAQLAAGRKFRKAPPRRVFLPRDRRGRAY